jgi:hypothetical protein
MAPYGVQARIQPHYRFAGEKKAAPPPSGLLGPVRLAVEP